MKYWFIYNLTDGTIHGAPYLGNVDEWTNIPNGCGVLGPIDETDATATDAWQNPTHYTVSNGKLALVSNVSALQLSAAQASKKDELSNAVAAKITAGYQSTVTIASTGKTYLYGTELVDQQNMTASRVWSDNNPTSVVKYRPSGAVGRIDHTRAEWVTISDAVFSRVNWYLDQVDAYLPQIYGASATADSVNAIVITISDPA